MTLSVALPRPAPEPREGAQAHHLSILDGWRGISILLVLATHMLPLGPKWLQLNVAAGMLGMSLFFTLSGFLITTSLSRDSAVIPFLIKRMFRIVPLTWAFVFLVVATQTSSLAVIFANLFFYANNSETYLSHAGHLWSISLEMQFYVFVAMLVGVGGRRAIMLLPLLAIAVTLGRVAREATAGVLTFDRIDEILSGAILALVLLRGWRPPQWLCKPWIWILLLGCVFVGSQPHVRHHFPIFAYLRPYLAATAVGLSIFTVPGPITKAMSGPVLRYIARISFALYILHPLTYAGWLGSGDTLERYLKRPISFALTFVAAHVSTFFFERPLNSFGHDLAGRFTRSSAPAQGVQS